VASIAALGKEDCAAGFVDVDGLSGRRRGNHEADT
jgi:hypothetical protein